MTERHHDSVGAYLLGALPELERQAFERHLLGCTDCRDELERLGPVADALPRAVTQVAPSPELKAALMDSVRAEATAADPRAARSRSRRRWRMPVIRLRLAPAAALAAVLLALGVAAGALVGGLGDERKELSFTAQVDPKRLVEGSGSLRVEPDRSSAVLSVNGVPDLPTGEDSRTYQLWLRRGGETIPAGVFSVGRDGHGAAAITDSIVGAQEVWVTRERAGGARAPSEPPVMRFVISS